MSVPQVVIVGRPNVGKSSIFNWIVGRRLAIVDNVAGVTRDRMTQLVDRDDHYFELVDTGGIGLNDIDDLEDEIEQQIQLAINSADLILFAVDIREGILPLDEEVARRLRKINKPIVCVANKADQGHLEVDASHFFKLGQEKIVPVSTLQNRNKDDLLDAIFAHLPDQSEENHVSDEPEMKVAIVGRRNVGKSTFVNALSETDRMIVSDVAGTTRDSVDVRFELDGKSFVAIDTPGMRRRISVKTDIDFYGTHRAHRTVRHADVILLFFDASQQISRVDKQLISYIAESHKPCIFVVNKWDLYHDKMPTERWVEYLRENFPSMRHAPLAFITAKTGKNVKTLINHAQMLFKQARYRVGTGALNRIIRFALEQTPPPLYKNRRPKVYYATQIGIQPPTIVLKCNSPEGFTKTYRRYLLNVLRENVEFAEVPIRIYFHKRISSDSRDDKIMPEEGEVREEGFDTEVDMTPPSID
ncbi:MAG: ribosome biogenesis GTPase Der [Pirellulales bacterium]|jgi:GTP-binding protein